LEERIIDTGHSTSVLSEPKFDSIGVADTYLADDGQGIAVEADGLARFYPYQIMSRHQLVNDVFATRNLLVSYDPLTIRPAVYLRDDTFDQSGQVLDNNFLFTDSKTGSFWIQATGEAITGALTGSTLKPYPWQVMSWSAFKNLYPQGQSLNRDTGYNFDYTEDPFWAYYESNEIYYPLSHFDARAAAKEPVLGYHSDSGPAKAWLTSDLEKSSVINDELGDEALVLLHDPNQGVNIIFSRLVEKRTLDFVYRDEKLLDTETESVWNFSGRCVSGELAGTELNQLQLEPSYWFGWATTYPHTEL
ncbi:MAG: DUF3179 domain-containing (seleno)protein, partial [Candidatus Uhrbacteria bacterium]